MRIQKNIRREVEINGQEYIIWIGPKGMLFKVKRKRLGKLLPWEKLEAMLEADGLDCRSLEDDDDSN